MKPIVEHVLCVDDDPEFLSSLEFFLPERVNRDASGQVWYRFLFFESPVEAINSLQDLTTNGETVAMVISDQKMPHIKGTDLLARTKAISPQSVRVLLTGYAGLESAIQAINDQLLDKYLTKPIEDEHDFVVSIRHLLYNSRLRTTVADQNRALQSLYEFANTLNATPDFQATLEYLVTFCHDTLQCQDIAFLLLEEGELRVRSGRGRTDPTARPIPISASDLYAHFQERRVWLATRHQEIPYLGSTVADTLAWEGPILYAGLRSTEQIIGIIQAGRRSGGRHFRDDDLHHLGHIADAASIAVQNQLNRLRLQQAYLTVKKQADELVYQATHDPLTRLPNRRLLHSFLEHALLLARRERHSVAVLLLDLNRFKEINDTLSHQNGDRLLQQIGARLREALRESDTIARLGGDEFAVLLPGSGTEAATAVARKVLGALERPFALEGLSLEVGTAIGIAVFPEHGEDADLLLQRADVAMYVAKQSGNEYFVYAAQQDHYSPSRLQLLAELRHAIDNNQLLLHYQPKIDFRTKRVAGVEALVRWAHPTLGLVMPDRFIPLAEQTGLIKPLSQWVLRAALKQCRAWHHSVGGLRIAVNLSARNLHDPGLPDQIQSLLASAQVEPHWLELEITESMLLLDAERALETLNRLKQIGVGLAIDDFGSGYSSLAYLRKLPVQTIKIDKSFVINMVSDRDGAVIVRSTIELAHTLGLKVVAEGVENAATWNTLSDLGCDEAQGYYMSRPLPAEQLREWLTQSPWGAANASPLDCAGAASDTPGGP